MDELLRDERGRFASQGIGAVWRDGRVPASTTLPKDVDAYVRSLPDRSNWLRDAVDEKIKTDREPVKPKSKLARPIAMLISQDLKDYLGTIPDSQFWIREAVEAKMRSRHSATINKEGIEPLKGKCQIGVRLYPHQYRFVKSQPNVSDWLRTAILEQIEGERSGDRVHPTQQKAEPLCLQTISVWLLPDQNEYLKSLPKASAAWLREAVLEKVEREGIS